MMSCNSSLIMSSLLESLRLSSLDVVAAAASVVDAAAVAAEASVVVASVCGLMLLVYEALSYYCMRP